MLLCVLAAAAVTAGLLGGILLMFLAVMVFVGVAVAASTRFGQVMTLLMCVGVFFVGSMHPYLFGRWADKVVVVKVLGYLFPKLTYFYPLDALTLDKPIPLSFVATAGGYCACYVMGTFAIGVGIFQRRQLAAEQSCPTVPGLVSLIAWVGRIVSGGMVITCGVLMLLPGFHNTRGFAVGGILLLGGVAGWLLWGFFGRGARWSWWMVLLVCAAVLGRGAGLFIPGGPEALKLTEGRGPIIIETIVSAVVLGVLILPKTRRHFKSTG